MIFRPELVRKIKAGDKTMTRRPVKPGEKDCRYQPGKAYAVQPGRTHAQVCRITITDVRQEAAGEISFKDARKEGFRTTTEFKDYWKTLYGSFDAAQPVWVIAFELGDSTDKPRLLVSGAGRERFKAAPGRKQGSKRQVVADTETSQDYVTQPHLAMAGEPEAVTEHEQTKQSVVAHTRDQERLADPLRKKRDELAQTLGEMYELLPQKSGIRDSIRRLEREMEILNRKLAA